MQVVWPVCTHDAPRAKQWPAIVEAELGARRARHSGAPCALDEIVGPGYETYGGSGGAVA